MTGLKFVYTHTWCLPVFWENAGRWVLRICYVKYSVLRVHVLGVRILLQYSEATELTVVYRPFLPKSNIMSKNVEGIMMTGRERTAAAKATTRVITNLRPLHRISGLLAILCLLTLPLKIKCEPIAAMDQAIGQWLVKLSPCSSWFTPNKQLIFPPRGLYDEKESSALARRSSLDCRLSLFRNGTFCMAPMDDATPLSPIHGSWQVLSNPYCATDRYYDNVRMKSYRRCQKSNEGATLQQGQFQLHAKMWGRYESYTGIRRRLSRIPLPRMNHGTVVWKNDDVEESPWKTRRVCATFTAKRCQQLGLYR
jgi:hypothetical protein